MNSLEYYLKKASEISLEVGNFLLSRINLSKDSFHKSGTHYFIEDDISADNLYRNFLEKYTPEASFMSEEVSIMPDTEMVWVVDSIEGTSNYRASNPFFATQICLLQKNIPVVSVIYAPKLNEFFTAIKGKGAFLNGKKIEVSSNQEIGKSIVSIGKGTRRSDLRWWSKAAAKTMRFARSIRLFGSTGLELSYVACGRLDAHINYGSKNYDLAPGSLIVAEAGGTTINFQGNKWTIFDNELISSNKFLSGQIVKMV